MNISAYREEVSRELTSILAYWMMNSPDEQRGGFIGRIDGDDRKDADAPKGLVLNARILWAFSAAWHYTGQWIYGPVATRAYDYLNTYFFDRQFGGAFWSVEASGQPLNTRKQIYGQAFALYALSEYYKAIGIRPVLDEAIGLYRLIESRSYDPRCGGYFEAFDREWAPLEDQRLSRKDVNGKKTMNTNLHILEAYTNLYRVWPDAVLRRRICGLLDIFVMRIIDEGSAHLGLYFGEGWELLSGRRSYGHDIEAAWLLHAAAVAVDDKSREEQMAGLAVKMAIAAAEGLDVDGGLWYEGTGDLLIREKHWWPQAEAMVGFLRVWQLTGEACWWQRSAGVWDFVKKYIRHPRGKEWYWGIGADRALMAGEDKAGFWKCPYHNSRACLEIMRSLDGVTMDILP